MDSTVFDGHALGRPRIERLKLDFLDVLVGRTGYTGLEQHS